MLEALCVDQLNRDLQRAVVALNNALKAGKGPGGLQPTQGQLALLEDIAKAGRFVLKAFPQEVFDLSLRVHRSDGTIEHRSFALQTGLGKSRTTTPMWRESFKFQLAVQECKQLALLFNCWGMWCLTAGDMTDKRIGPCMRAQCAPRVVPRALLHVGWWRSRARSTTHPHP